jgi:hypothetical protein
MSSSVFDPFQRSIHLLEDSIREHFTTQVAHVSQPDAKNTITMNVHSGTGYLFQLEINAFHMNNDYKFGSEHISCLYVSNLYNASGRSLQTYIDDFEYGVECSTGIEDTINVLRRIVTELTSNTSYDGCSSFLLRNRN